MGSEVGFSHSLSKGLSARVSKGAWPQAERVCLASLVPDEEGSVRNLGMATSISASLGSLALIMCLGD